MNSQKRLATFVRILFASFVVTLSLLILNRVDVTHGTAEVQLPTQGQEQKRMVSRKPWRAEPVRVIAAKNRKKANIEIGKPFDDDGDWLNGFTVTVVNNSNQTVTAVTIEMVFPREPGDPRPKVGQALHFGLSPFRPEYSKRDRSKLIRVGDTAELQLRPENYGSLINLLKQQGYQTPIKEIELEIREVGFEDGSALLSGTLWVQDPSHPDDPTKKIRAEKPKPPGARNQKLNPVRQFTKTVNARPPARTDLASRNHTQRNSNCLAQAPQTDYCDSGLRCSITEIGCQGKAVTIRVNSDLNSAN